MNKPKQGVPGLTPPSTSRMAGGDKEISECCGASVFQTKGGKVCSKCKNKIVEKK